VLGKTVDVNVTQNMALQNSNNQLHQRYLSDTGSPVTYADANFLSIMY
jgi:hypothetical protein